ncbi:unnamed protein product [Blepharisma stoltei]|uniref:Secreted protein n=1 Tax=Blepharisma stoltei TaxID=1481888 RepID=A0AAU9JX05_9CILI|nr:unnamed protein product [Blepharisma stoltei]
MCLWLSFLLFQAILLTAFVAHLLRLPWFLDLFLVLRSQVGALRDKRFEDAYIHECCKSSLQASHICRKLFTSFLHPCFQHSMIKINIRPLNSWKEEYKKYKRI